jgi:hypothetical protein
VSALVAAGTTRSSDWYAGRTRAMTVRIAVVSSGLAIAYAMLVVATRGDPMLLVPLAGVLVVGAIIRWPVAGVFFQNVSAYTPVPLRLSVADALLVLTLASWAVRRVARREFPRGGPVATAIALYVGVFGIGTLIGVARGGDWDPNAALAEVRCPIYVGVLYFLTADLVRSRGQMLGLAWAFVLLVGVKGLQGVVNYFSGSGGLEAVTSHEDVVFFNVAIGLAVVTAVAGTRTKLSLAIALATPFIFLAELFTERRAGFIGLGVVLVGIALLFLITDPRRGIALVILGALAISAYVPTFWDQTGPIAEPIRAIRAALDDPSVTVRDQLSDRWRDIENSNIAFTMRQLPLTGVGVGQEYLFQKEPPKLPSSFTYWRFMTHNAVLWLWLKAGPLGAFALWFLVVRVLLLGSSLWVRLRDPDLRLLATMPIALVMGQMIFSSVELGLTYSRTMIVLGVTLGLMGPLARCAAPAVIRDRARKAA